MPDLLDSLSDEELAALHEAVDSSDYSLADWAEALAAFDAWLADRGEVRRPWREIVGYVDCCTFTASPGVALASLKVIVVQALTEFGFQFIEESQD